VFGIGADLCATLGCGALNLRGFCGTLLGVGASGMLNSGKTFCTDIGFAVLIDSAIFIHSQ